MNSKKAQIQMTFNWIYILVAGIVILLFFVGIIVKGTAVAKESLEGDVVRIVESILVGAGVSEKTKNFIDVSGLTDYTLEFKCEDDFASLGIKDGAFRELPIAPIFAPIEIRTSGLVTWSLPYKLPFKVTDLLMITSTNTKYYVVGDDGQGFREEMEKALSSQEEDQVKFNFEFLDEDDYDLAGIGGNQQVRVVYLSPLDQIDFGNIPANLNDLGPKQLSAVDISGRQIQYYTKMKGNSAWRREGETMPLVSLSGEKEAARYAAIFAGNAESYKCNMRKVFERLEYVAEVYAGKLQELKEYYVAETGKCHEILTSRRPNNMGKVFNFNFYSRIGTCQIQARRGEFSNCGELLAPASELQAFNEELRGECITLY